MMQRPATIVALIGVAPIGLLAGAGGCGSDDRPAGYVYQEDSAGPDAALFVDAGSPDGGPLDDAPPDGAPSDTGAADTGAAAVCQGNELGCADDRTPRFCSQGRWLSLSSCGSGYRCARGQCTCSGECKAIGQQECLPDLDAIKICKLEDGCLRWGVPQACKPGWICVQGACIEAPKTCDPPCPKGHTCSKGKCIPPDGCTPPCSTGQVCDQGSCVGTMSCAQIHGCVTQFASGPDDKVNIDACVAKGTAAAQALYAKRKACIALSCQKLIDAHKVNEAMLCMYSKCGAEQGQCLGAGAKGCAAFANCLSGCKNSAICLIECHASALIEAVKQWYGLLVCGEQYCPGLNGEARAQCTVQKCQGPYNNCFGGGGGGSWSCKQILACVKGSCQDKACADQCKAKGSARGLAALQALLNCQKANCSTYCGGSEASCQACVKALCPQQNTVCGYAP